MLAIEKDEVKRRAADLQMLLLDVDGVMTDGGIILIGETEEAKRFDVKDGMGVVLARAAGLKVGLITSRQSLPVNRRAAELKIDDVFQGYSDKEEALDKVLEKYALEPVEVGYLGDDIIDLPVMKRIGLPVAVGDACPEVKARSVYVTRARGGYGAVREVVDWLLELRGQKERVYSQFATTRGESSIPGIGG